MTREYINIYLDAGRDTFMTSMDAGGEAVHLARPEHQPDDLASYVVTTEGDPILLDDIIAHVPETMLEDLFA